MDPYLEGSEWTSVHTALAVEIAKQLTPRLLPKYIARTEKRFVVTSMDFSEDVGVSSVYPDAAIAKNPGTQAAPVGSSTAPVTPLTMATVVPERVPQVTVVIRDKAQRQVVTAIEILSPTNKQGDDRAEYLERRQRLLLSAAHLVEIDLLRSGQRVPMQQHLPSVPYFVFVGRAERRPMTDVWPITLREPLPTIPIPLLPGDADVPLDLQQAFAAVYDGCAYGAAIDYTKAAEIPLTEDDATWAVQHIANWTESGS
jgi:hypothetical protein